MFNLKRLDADDKVMKILLLFLVVLPSVSHAILCSNYSEKPNVPYYFVDSMFSSLKKLNQEMEGIRKSKDEDTVFVITTSIPRINCVIEELKPFTKSTNPKIVESAEGVSTGVQSLIENLKKQIELLKSIEDGTLQGHTNIQASLGESVNKMDNAWSIISLAVVGSSFSLIDDAVVSKDGTIKSLVITEVQKKSLIKKIEKDFITKNKKKYQLEGTASAYLSFLKDKWNTKK
jgi:hypothetical protein